MSIVDYNLWICHRHLAALRLSLTPLALVYAFIDVAFRIRSLTHKQCGPVNLHDRLAALYVVLNGRCFVHTSISFITIMFHTICNKVTNNGLGHRQPQCWWTIHTHTHSHTPITTWMHYYVNWLDWNGRRWHIQFKFIVLFYKHIGCASHRADAIRCPNANSEMVKSERRASISPITGNS